MKITEILLFVGILGISIACYAQKKSDHQTQEGKIHEFRYTNPITRDTSIAMRDHYTLVNGPLTPQYNNDATLFEAEDGQVYFYCSGNGLFQAKIDLNTGQLTTPIEKFLDKKEPGWPE
jgi:hypothetical protein